MNNPQNLEVPWIGTNYLHLRMALTPEQRKLLVSLPDAKNGLDYVTRHLEFLPRLVIVEYDLSEELRKPSAFLSSAERGRGTEYLAARTIIRKIADMDGKLPIFAIHTALANIPKVERELREAGASDVLDVFNGEFTRSFREIFSKYVPSSLS